MPVFDEVVDWCLQYGEVADQITLLFGYIYEHLELGKYYTLFSQSQLLARRKFKKI